MAPRKTFNGFPVYGEGEKCDGCGAVQHAEAKDEPAGYVLTCPACDRVGCDECMPMGRGVPCLDCENA